MSVCGFVMLSGVRTGGLEEANCFPVINLPVCIPDNNANSSYLPNVFIGNANKKKVNSLQLEQQRVTSL